MKGSAEALSVTFEYTDNRHAEGRGVTVGPARVRELLGAGVPLEITEGQEVYDQYCSDNGIEAVEAPEPEPAAPVEIETPNGAMDGWPDAVDPTRKGSYYTFEVAGETARVRGKVAAQETAWKMVNAASA